jgi:hypothetical protein
MDCENISIYFSDAWLFSSVQLGEIAAVIGSGSFGLSEFIFRRESVKPKSQSERPYKTGVYYEWPRQYQCHELTTSRKPDYGSGTQKTHNRPSSGQAIAQE